ncbi:hypothetical protein SLS62_001565 [Diatrype stigma]|uniref:Cytochrome P450 n=1 Tax=Diatrype stigma TaxID=117547 RepID=A0AAN9UVH5_9PEZI
MEALLYEQGLRVAGVSAYKLTKDTGPIVRSSPGNVYVADPASVQRIFQIKGEFKKASWYSRIAPGAGSVFSTTDVETHRRFRRLLSGPMSESGLKAVLPQVESKVRLAVQRIGEEMESKGAADVWKWWLFMATDVIGELSFGESFRMLEYRKINQYAKDLQTLDKMNSLRVTFPIVLWISWLIPSLEINNAGTIVPRILGYARQSIERHRALVENGDGAHVARTLLQKVYQAQEDESMTTEELTTNARTYIVAGSDTTANTLTWLTWAVCRGDPQIRKRLAAEVGALSPDFTNDDVKHLPYLNQVIQETLRLYPAVPAGLARTVPPGEGVTFAGRWLPAGTTVLAQAYSLHRDPVAFPDAERFDPSRWEKPTQAMKDSFMPFGGGSRTCLGIHLAYIELRMGAARFIREFPNASVSSLEGMCDEDMIADAFFLASPRGHRCLIQRS